jgi:hypothetical protein
MGLIDEALARQAARPEPRRIDYDRMNRVMPKQKAALTRAVNAFRKAKQDAEKSYERETPAVVAARERIAEVCRAAVLEWNEIGAWPDNWHTWNIALNDSLHWSQHIDLQEL